MLGFLVPGWTDDAAKEAIVIDLVKELLELFGPSRCMFASNWHGSGASSNADYCDECQPTMTELYEKFQGWCDGPLGLDAEAQAMVFAGTRGFYRRSVWMCPWCVPGRRLLVATSRSDPS